MSKISKIILLFPFLFSCASNSSDSNTDSASNKIHKNSSRSPVYIRVATINVWSGLDYKGTFSIGEYQASEIRNQRTQNLIEQLSILDADIIAVNEANMLPEYAQSLADTLNYDQINDVGLGGLHIGKIGFPVNLFEGDVILAEKSFQLESIGRSQLSGGPSGKFLSFHFEDATQVIGGKISIENQNIYIFNTHWHASPCPSEEYFRILTDLLESNKINQKQYEKYKNIAIEGEECRIDEARKTITFIEKKAGNNPVILMGDFNSSEKSLEIGLIKAAGFRDAYIASGTPPGYTWDGKNNPNIQIQIEKYPVDFCNEPSQRRIDYIFYRGTALQAVMSKIILNKPVHGIYPSDHYGVMAEFKLTIEE